MKFIEKYPDIYMDGIKNEGKNLDKNEKNAETQYEEMEDAI